MLHIKAIKQTFIKKIAINHLPTTYFNNSLQSQLIHTLQQVYIYIYSIYFIKTNTSSESMSLFKDCDDQSRKKGRSFVISVFFPRQFSQSAVVKIHCMKSQSACLFDFHFQIEWEGYVRYSCMSLVFFIGLMVWSV